MKKFNTVAIIGVGLIGGAFGMALRRQKLAVKVIGIGRNEARLKKAVKLEAITEYSLDYWILGEADLVFLATPVIHITEMLAKIGPYLKAGAVVTDGGSTKEGIVNAANKYLPLYTYFVGSHPIAGSEKNGVQFASTGLFRGSVCAVTPDKLTDKTALKKITGLWKAFGAKVVTITPGEHDRIIAATSHLPHFAAAALAGSVISKNKNLRSLIGKGFKDTTRIAVSNPEVWAEIALANKKNVCKSIKAFIRKITKLEKFIRKGKTKEIVRLLKEAKVKRESI
ncbi:MAG: prephenate dehydrogenase [Candidatus Firestonebacteria bacterium]